MAFVRAVKCWSYTTILDGLGENRSENDKVDILNSFYKRCVVIIANAWSAYIQYFQTTFIQYCKSVYFQLGHVYNIDASFCEGTKIV